jgi:hypothetical protein
VLVVALALGGCGSDVREVATVPANASADFLAGAL